MFKRSDECTKSRIAWATVELPTYNNVSVENSHLEHILHTLQQHEITYIARVVFWSHHLRRCYCIIDFQALPTSIYFQILTIEAFSIIPSLRSPKSPLAMQILIIPPSHPITPTLQSQPPIPTLEKKVIRIPQLIPLLHRYYNPPYTQGHDHVTCVLVY